MGKNCQNGYLAKKQPLCHFGTFFPVHQFQKFFLPNDFSLIIMKDLLHNFSQKVYLALSRPVHVLIWEDKLNYFKLPSLDFKIFLPNDFSLNIMKDLLHNFPQKVYLALSRPIHVLIWEGKLNYLKFPSLDFKNSS